LHSTSVVAVLAIIIAGTMGGLYVNTVSSVNTVTLNQMLKENDVTTITTTTLMKSISIQTQTQTQTETTTNEVNQTTIETDDDNPIYIESNFRTPAMSHNRRR
jgi:hypothetical protein